MKYLPKRGQTANIAFVFIPDSASTIGGGKVGLTNASTALNISVRRELSAVFSTYTGANILTITTLGTWADPTAGKCRFKECDATNAPGMYEIHFVDAVFDASDTSRKVVGSITATGIVPTPFEIQLSAVDIQDGVRYGLTALPAIATPGAGALLTSGTGIGQLNVTSGIADANTRQVNSVAIGVADGTCQASGQTVNNIRIAASDPAGDDIYKFRTLTVVAGMGAGQARIIITNNGTSKDLTPHRPLLIALDNTSQYAINDTAEVILPVPTRQNL
jgi:hypothetical protein